MRAPQVLALLLAVAIFAPSGAAPRGDSLTESDACTILEKRLAKVERRPVSDPSSLGWFCDFSELADAHWYVIDLRTHTDCAAICTTSSDCERACSSHIGWYAVNRDNGAVHLYDMTKLKVGAEVTAR